MIPDNDWENLQNVLRSVHNRLVREEFSDVGDDNWDPDITTPRGQLRYACTMKDEDTADMSLIRMFLFYVILRKATDFHPALYTTPTDRYQQLVRFAPQVTLYFKEDIEDVENGYAPIDAEISFRLVHENQDSITRTDLQTLANRIRAEFATGSGYRWRKGRTKANYRDQEHGYLLSINAYSESEAIEVIRKVLDIQNHALDGSKMTFQTLSEPPPIVPPQKMILGKSRRLPRKRPVGYVRFVYAEIHIWGIPDGICLIDRSGRRRNPIIAA